MKDRGLIVFHRPLWHHHPMNLKNSILTKLAIPLVMVTQLIEYITTIATTTATAATTTAIVIVIVVVEIVVTSVETTTTAIATTTIVLFVISLTTLHQSVETNIANAAEIGDTGCSSAIATAARLEAFRIKMIARVSLRGQFVSISNWKGVTVVHC